MWSPSHVSDVLDRLKGPHLTGSRLDAMFQIHLDNVSQPAVLANRANKVPNPVIDFGRAFRVAWRRSAVFSTVIVIEPLIALLMDAVSGLYTGRIMPS